MIGSGDVGYEELTSNCMRCHDLCLAIIDRGCRNLTSPTREIVLGLLSVCVDACRMTAATVDCHGGPMARAVRECACICGACGDAIIDLDGLAACAVACYSAALSCRKMVRQLTVQ